MDFSERAGEAVLDEVIRCDWISRQLSRITFQPGKQRLDIPVQGIVYSLLAARTALPCRRTTATGSRRIGSLGLHIHRYAPSFLDLLRPNPRNPEKRMAFPLDLIDSFVQGS